MSEHTLNRIAKVLAGIGTVAVVFAIAAVGTINERDCLTDFVAGCPNGGFATPNVMLCLVCAAIAATAFAVAVSIRRGLGGPLVGPWKGW